MKARRVQQPEPTRAIKMEKFGMHRTMMPVRKTRPVRSTH